MEGGWCKPRVPPKIAKIRFRILRVLRINSVLYRMGRLRSPYDPSLIYRHSHIQIHTHTHSHTTTYYPPHLFIHAKSIAIGTDHPEHLLQGAWSNRPPDQPTSSGTHAGALLFASCPPHPSSQSLPSLKQVSNSKHSKHSKHLLLPRTLESQTSRPLTHSHACRCSVLSVG